MDRRRECLIEICTIRDGRDRRIVLPLGCGASMELALDMPLPRAVKFSDEFVHMRWNDIQSFWRPFDLLASFRFSNTRHVRLLVSRPSDRHDEPATRGRPLRAKVDSLFGCEEVPTHDESVGGADLPMDEIANIVRVLTVRAQGHTCLHAATVTLGERGVLLMGPSGSGKTTTALSLLRGGFEMFSDEHSVLNTGTGGTLVTGFRSAPRILDGARYTLAQLERTLETRGMHKTPVAVPRARRGSQSTWLRPAAMLFLRIRPGGDHSVRSISAEEAFVRVMKQVLDPTNVFRQEEQAQAVIRLVEGCPAHELALGNNLASLPEFVRGVMESAR